MKLDKTALTLYAVTDRHWAEQVSLEQVSLGQTSLENVSLEKNVQDVLFQHVKESLLGGVTMVQLREKDLDYANFKEEALSIQKLCAEFHVPFLINDNVELAKEIDADGVHIGQSDMELIEARKILGAHKIIGVSAQTVEQAVQAEKNGADYLGVGAVFPTSSKSDAVEVNHETLKAICSAVKIPVVAIGGITQENISLLKNSGICGVAVISAIFAQKDITAASKSLFAKAKEFFNE